MVEVKEIDSLSTLKNEYPKGVEDEVDKAIFDSIQKYGLLSLTQLQSKVVNIFVDKLTSGKGKFHEKVEYMVSKGIINIKDKPSKVKLYSINKE